MRTFLLTIRLGLFLLPLLHSSAHAFPGMIRHGYPNCTSCHVSPSGGGVLTDYGRELSRELLSTWGKEGEERFAFGALEAVRPQNLQLGGDTRLIQLYQNNSRAIEKRFFLMQADLEAAYTLGHWTLDAEFGYVDSDTFDSLRHFLMYRLGDEDALRLGRFHTAFGIYTPAHTEVNRRNLGFDEGTENYNLEYSHLGEKYALYVSGIFGRPESQEVRNNGFVINSTGTAEKGAAARGSIFVADHYELGGQAYYGSSDLRARYLVGTFFSLGFRPDLYWLAELDFQHDNTAGQWGAVQYQRLTYEPIQGIELFGTQEISRLNFASAASQLNRYGVGVAWYPRPHWEADLRWHWYRNGQTAGDGYDQLAWAMLHFYY